MISLRWAASAAPGGKANGGIDSHSRLLVGVFETNANDYLSHVHLPVAIARPAFVPATLERVALAFRAGAGADPALAMGAIAVLRRFRRLAHNDHLKSSRPGRR